MFCLAFEPGARTSPDRLFDSRGFGFAIGRGLRPKQRGGPKDPPYAGVMAIRARNVKKWAVLSRQGPDFACGYKSVSVEKPPPQIERIMV
jgi:hypothetical protein